MPEQSNFPKIKVSVELYRCWNDFEGRRKTRRIAVLPNVSDELLDLLKKEYPKPNYWVRLITEIFEL